MRCRSALTWMGRRGGGGLERGWGGLGIGGREKCRPFTHCHNFKLFFTFHKIFLLLICCEVFLFHIFASCTVQ